MRKLRVYPCLGDTVLLDIQVIYEWFFISILITIAPVVYVQYMQT